MMLRTDSVLMPGRSIQTAEISYAGPLRKIGYDSILNQAELTIYLSEDLTEKVFFQEWQDLIVGQYRQGVIAPDMYSLGFYDDYVGEVLIRHFSDTGELLYNKKLQQAYPIHIGDISRSWIGDSEIMKLNVTMTYRFFVDANA